VFAGLPVDGEAGEAALGLGGTGQLRERRNGGRWTGWIWFREIRAGMT